LIILKVSLIFEGIQHTWAPMYAPDIHNQ
jgi:hypothetical protein